MEKGVNVTIVNNSPQVVAAEIFVKEIGMKFQVIVVYAFNSVSLHEELWRDLSKWGDVNIPCLITGDFNVVHFSHEKRGGDPHNSQAMSNFKSMIQHLGMMEIPGKGCKFSWSNRQQGANRIDCKLDRSLGNGAWINVFSASEVRFLPSGISDHCPQIIKMVHFLDFSPKPFKIFNAWAMEEDLKKVIEKVWCMNFSGPKMFRVVKKLRAVKGALKLWSKQKLGVFHQLNKVKKSFEDIQMRLDSNAPTNSLCLQELETRNEFNRLMVMEENMLKRKSRIKWLALGDQNNSFFHKSLLV